MVHDQKCDNGDVFTAPYLAVLDGVGKMQNIPDVIDIPSNDCDKHQAGFDSNDDD